MEPGAHIGAVTNKLKHDPTDFVVPLLQVCTQLVFSSPFDTIDQRVLE